MKALAVSERQIWKELMAHPWMSRELAKRIAEDHARRPKTNTKEGKRIYMKNYMRFQRGTRKLLVPDVASALGLKQRRRQGK